MTIENEYTLDNPLEENQNTFLDENKDDSLSKLNETDETKKKPKKSKDTFADSLVVLEKPQRKIPLLIEEILTHDIPVKLTKNGYFVAGFYGLNEDTENTGWVFIQETTNPDVIIAYDNKNHRFAIQTFEDLVKLNNYIWSIYFKTSDKYKKPDMLWFSLMLQYGVLNIMPGSFK